MNRTWQSLIALALVTVGFVSSASAAESTDAEQPWFISATWSATAALDIEDSAVFESVHRRPGPMFELIGEAAVTDHLGASLVGGYASYTVPDADLSLWEVGAQLNQYVLGDFSRGLQLGVQALAMIEHSSQSVRGSSEPVDEITVYPSAALYAGGKIIYPDLGFTLNAQLGAEFMAGRTHSSPFSPLLNLNVGWSF